MSNTVEKIRWIRANGKWKTICWPSFVMYTSVNLWAVIMPFKVPFAWYYPFLALATFLVGMWFVTGANHRYFSHGTYKTSRWFQAILALGCCMTAQRDPFWWAAHHIHHHTHVDTEDDLHSPSFWGLLFAHVGWILSKVSTTPCSECAARVEERFGGYWEMRLICKYPLVIAFLTGVTFWLIGGWSILTWCYLLPLVFLWNGTFLVNSYAHWRGERPYKRKDTSANSFFVALITLGEGWHNNHHQAAASMWQGFFRGEIDATAWVLCQFEKIGLVWDLREPSMATLKARMEAAWQQGKIEIPKTRFLQKYPQLGELITYYKSATAM